MPFYSLTFDKQGRAAESCTSALRESGACDIVFLAHGWLNDHDDAHELFDPLARQLEPLHVCAVHWPSKPSTPLHGLLREVVEIASYYTMKERAATIGINGVAPILQALHQAAPDIRIHLAGHSFGARLVTAAAASAEAPIHSLTLLQAAFSQFGFAAQGAFRNVIQPRRLRGPVVVTHSRHDLATGEAYPIASLIKRQNASGLGGPGDPYGALGRNGAQGLSSAECINLNLGDLESLKTFIDCPVINLNGDRIIRDHSDIAHPEIAATIKALTNR